MQIKDMFRKKIDREIQGVIIVGQGEETNVAQELEEYVVTRELQRHFADFFAAYKKGIQGTTPKMGVWISGFFGSGKSHFLKILSYLLQNKQVGDKHAIDYFIEDQKITNQMVLADMQLAANTPSDVILFNIDSKSDSNGKENKDAIVNVFLKVFNEMQGFCGSMPHLADLERRLSEEGRFEEFKEKFEEEYGDPWESSRQDFDFIQDSVVDVLSDMDFMSESAARNWCEKATEGYQISIEDFAKRVKSYIEKKGNNHHVVFLVDEIGQYIGDDSKLMLNLQTVTEELGKECMGKAWVIVTSQQDIDSITKVKGNDFSKIQGRFDTRLSLSSANVDAVIKKRILDKTETAAQSLRLLYDQKATIIKNLIVFNDGVEKKLYANAEDFAEVYPFVPYQFNLLASVLTSIRTHGASGKHLSEGERSMLALFKESAMQLMDDEMGAIVPFYRFYDALENFLDHSHSSVIIRAYDNSYINPEKKEKDVFAINVLKTLFLIKYVLEIEANVDNIVSLMITSIDDDRISLKAQVEDALKVLMRQMLIQKNGSIYVFLTDEEQEINNEIEKENVEMPEVITKIAEMIYEDIFSSKKYQYPSFGGRYAFSFNQTVDDRPYKANQNYDIGLRVLTPWYEGGTDDGTLRLLSGQGKEVLVVLPNDDAFLTEMRAYLKIERFLRKNTSVQLAKYETIKEAKRVEMRERNGNAKLYLTEALKEATIYVNGDVLHTSGKEVTSRINEAIGRLVQTVYHMLSSAYSMVKEADYHAADGLKPIIDRYLAADYNMDQQYRKFYYYYDQLESTESFEPLRELVENIYTNEYLACLLPAWNAGIQQDAAFSVIPLQRDFYNANLRYTKERTVVIISDAMRYEVGQELFARMQDDPKCTAKLSVQLSVLPSYTRLGMAALLPHKTLEMTDDFQVLADGILCDNLAGRQQVLQSYNPDSVCVQFDDIKNLKVAELRDVLTKRQIIYVYHNQIDARGDKANTEDEVFHACEEAVQEIMDLIHRISVSGNTYHFIVTADHGFIYKRDKLTESDKISGKSADKAFANRRFIVSKAALEDDGIDHMSMGCVLGNEDSKVVSYPVSSNVFKVAGGGANYVHGGSSPQEMLVPVLEFKMERGHMETKNAEIALVSIVHKITNLITSMDFIQSDAVSDTVKAAKYRIFFLSEDNEKISNENSYVADSREENAQKRIFRMRFTFKNKKYDKDKQYYLVVYDEESGLEQWRQPVIMDIAFADDFGFGF